MFNNLRELIASMPDEKACRDFLVQQRWNGKPVCPHCGYGRCYVIENGKKFKCANKECYKKFSVTVGTVFECSNISLKQWFTACYLITAHKKGISSYQLGRDIGVAQKTAWFMLHRIREMMRNKITVQLSGIVEADETYMARKYRSDFKGLTEEEIDYSLQHKTRNKGAVIGMAERSTTKIVVKAAETVNTEIIGKTIRDNVVPGSELHTDEIRFYNALEKDYKRETIFHSGNEWVRGNVTTNRVENFWSVMRRGIYGVYHQISFKHLQRYCDEFAYRYNSRKIKDADRFKISLTRVEGRLDYKTLVGKK